VSNRIEVIRETSFRKTIDLVDTNGQVLPTDVLIRATAEFLVRTSPDARTDALRLTTSNTPAGLAFRPERAALDLAIEPSDTMALNLQTYFYRLRVTLIDGTVSDAIPWSPFNVTLGGSSEPPPPPFNNTIKIDQNFRLPNDLAYISPAGSPIENAQIRVYLKSDYDAGNLGSPISATTTNAFGGWVNPILVNSGYTYIARFEKPKEWGPDTKEFFA
jgi:hypothetical protein